MLVSVLIDPKNMKAYGDLIPDCYHERLYSGEISAIASMDDSSDAVQGDALVGVVVLDVAEEWVKILWYALTPDYDSPDYARSMIEDRVLDAYLGGKAKGIFAELPAGERRSELEEIFVPLGFEVSYSESRVLSFLLEDTKAIPVVKSSAEFVPLGRLSAQDRRVFGNLIAQDKRAIPVEIPVCWDSYDQDLSLVHLCDGKPVGAILLRSSRGRMIVELGYENSPRGFVSLLSAIVERARAALSPDTEIIVPLVNERLAEFLKKVVSGLKGTELMKAYRRFEREDMDIFFSEAVLENAEKDF